MFISLTSKGYFAISLAWAFMVYRFYQYWKRDKTDVSRAFLYFGLFFEGLFLAAVALGFLIQISSLLSDWTLIISGLFLALGCSCLGYLIFYMMRFIEISPWLGFFIIFFLGTILTILSIFSPYRPYLEPNGSINWNFQGWVLIIRSGLYYLTFLPMGFILLKMIQKIKEKSARIKSLGLTILFFTGALIVTFDFYLERYFNLGRQISDIGLFFFAVFVFLIVFFTQKAPPPKYIPTPTLPYKIKW